MPIIGDIKYGNKEINKRFKDYRVAACVPKVFVGDTAYNTDKILEKLSEAYDYKNLSGNTFSAKPPKSFDFIMKA